MKPLLVLICVLVALLAGVLTTAWFSSAAQQRAPGVEANAPADVEGLRTELANLARRLESLERARPLEQGFERTNALGSAPSVAGSDGEGHDPHWYLEQYVRSFADDPLGSEYFRLAVDAYVIELVSPIADLVRDGTQLPALRMGLAGMLGRRRFQASSDVVDALLAAVRPPAPENLALRALDSLARVASVRAQAPLEALLFTLRPEPVRQRALALILELAGEQANQALLRLFLRAPDDATRRLLIRRLDGAELAAALELLRAASGMEQPVRLEAALKIGEYAEPEFKEFVRQWLLVETDEAVIAALGGAQKQQESSASWSAMKATGAPDADPRRDDPNAWASASPDMGLQWLQLSYATPTRAWGVRVHEVNSPGALSEVRARTADGSWVTLWSGTASGNGSPLLIEFPRTSFDVSTIRLVLDTDRTPGWNEIDAVELLGSGGSQWASQASASSNYNGGGGLSFTGMERVIRFTPPEGAPR